MVEMRPKAAKQSTGLDGDALERAERSTRGADALKKRMKTSLLAWTHPVLLLMPLARWRYGESAIVNVISISSMRLTGQGECWKESVRILKYHISQ